MPKISTKGPHEDIYVVGVGASAGGIDACLMMLRELPADTNIAFVIVLHLDPRQPSHLAEVLGTNLSVPVVTVTEATSIEANHVYVIAPATSLVFADGEIRPKPSEPESPPSRSIDSLFESLGATWGEHAVAVVLSGLGHDGAEGLRAVKQAGGTCIVQDPETAGHDSMPRCAIATGVVDAVLTPAEIIPYILTEVIMGTTFGDGGPDADFTAVLDLLAEHHGLPVHDYKTGTLRRRAERHLAQLMCTSWAEYRAHLESHPEDLAALYEDVLIGVTRFFRDPDQWSYLEREILPRWLEAQSPDAGPLRVWSAGCATGEEAYSLAMLFLELLGRRSRKLELQVFATDLSQSAITFARRGEYPETIAQHLTPARLARFFDKHADHYQLKPGVRERLTFARHDLLTEPPLSRIDFIACRNLLIYLEPHAQHSCITRLHFALRPGGLLWLGSSESINRQVDLFSPVSRKYRVYRASGHRQADAVSWTSRTAGPGPGLFTRSPTERLALTGTSRATARLTRVLEQYVLEHYTRACVVINQAAIVLHLFGPTTTYLAPPRGELRVDLLSWVDDSALYARLRPAIEHALERRERVALEPLVLHRSDRNLRVRIIIEPIPFVAEGLFVVSFDEEPALITSGPPLAVGDNANGDGALAQHLAEQLHAAEVELQTAQEQLDTAHEDYRASYEELVSLNEELQSSNEELETIKEQAQSLNEELMTVNRELEQRNVLLGTVNADLENLLTLTTIPTVFLDRKLQIRRFTPASERVMWLVGSDVGRSIEHIKKRVDDPTLVADAERVLTSLLPVEVEVRAEDGRWYLRRIVPFRSGDRGDRIEGVCLIFHDVTAEKLATEQTEELRHFADAIVRAVRSPFVVFDHELHVIAANQAFFEAFRFAIPEGRDDGVGGVAGLTLHELGDGEWEIAPLREQLERVIHEKVAVHDFEFDHEFARIGVRHLRVSANLLERPRRTPVILMAIEDMTQLRAAQEEALFRTHELEQEHRRKDEFLAMLGHELRNPLAALVNGLTLLEQVGGDPVQRAKIHPMLERQIRRITVMLDQLLDIARVSWGKIRLDAEVVDLVDVVGAAVEAVQATIDAAHHHLRIDIPAPGTALVRGDLVRLIQVVENLLTNAVKYTEDGGEISLSVAVVDAEGGAAGPGSDVAAKVVRIRVADDGVGIEPELLEQIFEVFTQGSQSLARAQGGLGLGLPLVRRLVDMHGGRVEAHSAGRGKGSEFVVTLPLLDPNADAPEPEPELEAAAKPEASERA